MSVLRLSRPSPVIALLLLPIAGCFAPVEKNDLTRSKRDDKSMAPQNAKAALKNYISSINDADWEAFQNVTTESEAHPEYARAVFEFLTSIGKFKDVFITHLGVEKWEEFRDTTGPETRWSWPPPKIPTDADWFQPSAAEAANGIVYFQLPEFEGELESVVRFNEDRGHWTVDLLARGADSSAVPASIMLGKKLTEGNRDAIAAIEAGEKDLGVLMDTVAKPLTRRDDE